MDQLLVALSQLEDTGLIFTMPNADTDGRVFEKIKNFCREKDNAKAYTSLGQIRYLSCIRYVNELQVTFEWTLEVPSFKKSRLTLVIASVDGSKLRALSTARQMLLLFYRLSIIHIPLIS